MGLTKKLHLLLLLGIVASVLSCRQSKYVAEGNYLYKVKKRSIFNKNIKKRTIHFAELENDSIVNFSKSHEEISVDELNGYIKPQPNQSFKLFVYNRIDSTKMKAQVERKQKKVTKINTRRINKQNAINKKRNDKAKENGDSDYFQKVKRLKGDKTGWRFWVVDKIGEPPVIMDSSKVARSREQLSLFLKNSGYYENEVHSKITYKKWSRKAYASYTVISGQPIKIDSILFERTKSNRGIARQYDRMVKYKLLKLNKDDLLDHDDLDAERENISKFFRDNGYFNFSKSYIYFEVDTVGKNHLATITIKVIDPTFEDDEGNIKTEPHLSYKVNSVTYYVHNKDLESFKDYETYKARLEGYGLSDYGGNYPLLDTLEYVDSVFPKQFLLFGKRDTIVYRGTFIYNEELPVSPFLLDQQNFLEITDGGDNGWYKEYYIERSYSRLLGLDIFGSITPEASYESSQKRRVNISYDLTPDKKQLFSIEPQATNANGYLGLAATINYTNKNTFGGAEKLKFSLSGGAESQPPVFDRTVSGDVVQSSGRQLNTLEIHPKLTLETPRLIPLSKKVQKTMSKRLYPVTTFALGYNFQKRADFTRNLTEFGYSWKFNEEKTKIHRLKWQSFNFVKLAKSEDFESLLNELDDPFLINSYNDHFSNKFEYVFNYNDQNVNKNKGKDFHQYFNISGMTSGYIFAKTGIGVNDVNADGLRQILGVPFTQFVKVDADYRFYYDLSRAKGIGIAYRLLAGAGYAYGNSPSLPYEEGFFAGGSNDIRAWAARTVAPGGIQTWRDTSSTNTQIGDMRLEMNLEYRFQFNEVLKSALFIDAGNIWKIQDDASTSEDDLGVFSTDTFLEQLAIGAGMGFRLDFDFFIVRFDLAFPLHNPYMYQGERWIWESRDLYNAELSTLPESYVNTLTSPFALRLNFGIGYPF